MQKLMKNADGKSRLHNTYRFYLPDLSKLTRRASTKVDIHWPQQYHLITDYAAWVRNCPADEKTRSPSADIAGIE